MQTNVLNLEKEINYKLLFQSLMLIIVSFVTVVLTTNLQSIFLGLASTGTLVYNNFIYNPKRSRQFVLQAFFGVLCGFLLAVLLHNLPIAILPITIVLCFAFGFSVQVNLLLVLVLSIVISLIINYTNQASDLLLQLAWLAGGVLLYWISCILFDGYINERKLIATKQVDAVLINGWQHINQFNTMNNEQSLAKINKQLDRMVTEIMRLQQLRIEYDYYCELDDNFECQIENNLQKLTSFHELITKQVYNTILNQNQQLKAEELAQEFDELSD